MLSVTTGKVVVMPDSLLIVSGGNEISTLKKRVLTKYSKAMTGFQGVNAIISAGRE
jgi:hypothetical protein